MDKTTGNQLNKFLSKHNLTIDKIVRIVTEYAYSGTEVARSYLTEKYGISPHVYYKCRDYAIICSLVSSKCCRFIKQKSQENYSSHNSQNTARSSTLHFYELEKKREEYISSYTNEEILDIANMYAQGKPMDQICQKYSTGKSGINQLMYKGIAELIIDKPTTDILTTSMKLSQSLIDKMLDDRKKKKDELIPIMAQDVLTLKYKIDNYSTYFMRDQEKPSLVQLQMELEKASQRYKEVLML